MNRPFFRSLATASRMKSEGAAGGVDGSLKWISFRRASGARLDKSYTVGYGSQVRACQILPGGLLRQAGIASGRDHLFALPAPWVRLLVLAALAAVG